MGRNAEFEWYQAAESGVDFFMQIDERCSRGYKHLFMYLYASEHSTLQGGQWEREASQDAGCHWFAERTFHSARCTQEALGGGWSLGNTSIPYDVMT